jgi:hypothetical protein
VHQFVANSGNKPLGKQKFGKDGLACASMVYKDVMAQKGRARASTKMWDYWTVVIAPVSTCGN